MRSSRRLSIVLGLIAAVALPGVAAEVPFGAIQDLANPFAGAAGVAVGYVNLDHRLDVVFCSEDDGTVRLASQIGSGAFAIGTIASGLDSPYTVAIGDLDNDGDGDIVVGQFNNIAIPGGGPPYPPEAAELLWIENPVNGGGSWTMHGIFLFTYQGVRKVVLADMDGDGDLDVAYADAGSSPDDIGWAVNDGTPADGGWGSETVYGSMNNPFGLAAADLDGDGDIDLVGADTQDNDVWWFENDGAPTPSWTAHQVDGAFNGACSVATGDFDGDGAVDIVAAGGTGDIISWFEGSGASWTEHVVKTGYDNARAVFVADMDHDGDDDIVAAAESADDVSWFENSGGSSPTWVQHSLDGAFLGACDVAAGDLDGDADLEVVAAAIIEDRVSYWENQLSHNGFKDAEPIDIATGLGDPRGVAAGDLNGDGLTDVVTAMWDGDALTAYLGVSLAGTAWWTNQVGTGVYAARDVAIADINGDGAPDILSAEVDGDKISWWENDGAEVLPTWTEHAIVSGFNGAHRAEAADFDLDGDLDVVALAFDGDQIRWFENDNGAGTSWSLHNVAGGTLDGAFDVKVGDLDGDGDPDIVASGYYGDTIVAYLNNPVAGTFTASSIAIGYDGPRGIDLADFDHDGDLDVVAVIRNLDYIRWFENSGTGIGWVGHAVGTGTFVDGVGVCAGDIDHDGDPDVVATSQSGDDVHVWLNTGAGASWTRIQMEGSLDSPWDVVLAPVDSDGDLDIVVAAGGNADRVTWYPNVGGQCRVDAWDYAPSQLANGAEDMAFFLAVTHRGRTYWDADAELASLRIGFETAGGVALTSTQVNNVIETLTVNRDSNHNGLYDPGVDAVVLTDDYLTLSGGMLTLTVADGDFDARVVSSSTQGFFVVITSTADASSQSPNQIVMTLDTNEVVVEDYEHDLVLTGEPGEIVETGVLTLGSTVIFQDDFEFNNTSAWSATVGG